MVARQCSKYTKTALRRWIFRLDFEQSGEYWTEERSQTYQQWPKESIQLQGQGQRRVQSA